MFENFKNLFNSKNAQEEELFPYDDALETNVTPEMFNDDVIRIAGAKVNDVPDNPKT